MFLRLVAAFVVIPIVELYLLIEIGGIIGAGPTIGLVVVTGVLGAALARSQGLRVVREIQMSMGNARLPGYELIQGLLILIGGFTLLTPGILTDLLGLSMLLPVTRKIYARLIERYARRQIQSGQWRVVNADPADVFDVTPD